MGSDNRCPTCSREFPSGRRARDQHCRDTGHPAHKCDECSSDFSDESDYEDHMDSYEHWPYKCDFCPRSFRDWVVLAKHEHKSHRYCPDCCRSFRRTSNMKVHLRSRAHRGENEPCPFCGRGFVTVTGIAHHLERGSCPDARGLRLPELFDILRAKDPDGLITNSDSSVNSDLYPDDLYHCPGGGCGSEFSSLAGLFNHLESETCGYMKFENVQKRGQGLLEGCRRIEF